MEQSLGQFASNNNYYSTEYKWYIGTSGFSFDDWIGTVYPIGIKKNEMFTYYWQHYGFNCVELNYTFYKMPTKKTLVSILRKAPPKFKFSIKLHSSITHEGRIERLEDFLKITEVVCEEERLIGYLAQFPYSFKREPDKLEYIEKLIGTIKKNATKRVPPLFLEFRHESWADLINELEKRKDVHIVIPDLPKFKGMFQTVKTGQDTIYLRLHGRNRNWFEADEKTRYDYYYTDFELNELVQRIFFSDFRKAYVFFNNCYKGQALKNALKFRELVGGEKIEIF